MKNSEKKLDKLKLKKKNEKVYYAKNRFYQFSINDIYELKRISSKTEKLIRICLHKNDNQKIQEMIIMHKQPQSVGPLKQKKETISYHVLNGELDIQLSEKKIKKKFKIKKNESLRIPCNIFRKIKSTKKDTIFLEITSGPFKDTQTIWKKRI